MKTERKSVSSAHKLDGLGKLKEHAPRSEHKQNEEQHIIRDIKGTDTCYCHTKDNEFICRFDLLSSNNTHYTGMK